MMLSALTGRWAPALAWVYREAFRGLLQPVAPLADASSARAGAAHSAAHSSAFR